MKQQHVRRVVTALTATFVVAAGIAAAQACFLGIPCW